MKPERNALALALLLLSLCAMFAFLISSEREITVERCEKLGLPILQIETDRNKPVKRKDKYVKASYTLGELSGRCKIRGRGNSTWKTALTQKRPYLLKLDEEASLLGFPAARKWVLMANAPDRSMLRNFYAEHLAHTVWDRQRWSPSSTFITLFLNGKYMGLYGLTEKPEIAFGRVEFEGEGFLAEIDSHDRDYKFSGNHGVTFCIREPESSDENLSRWASKLLEIEEVLYSDDYTGEEGWRKCFDESSLVDWYLLAEFSKNYDARFYNSVFMNYDYGTGKLCMGPAWDHDIGFGNTAKTSSSVDLTKYEPLLPSEDWARTLPAFRLEDNSLAAQNAEGFLINQTDWYNRLFSDEAFVREVKDRWQQTRPNLEESFVWLEEQAHSIEQAAKLNDSVWKIIGSSLWPRAPGYKERRTYESEVDYLVSWCKARAEWLDQMFLE